MWNRKVFIRVIEVLLCIACVVALRVTDDESRRVFHYLRNRSREWSLLNNVTWGTIGAALATATCGGYVIITAGLLIAAATGELRGRKTELFFLGLGVILFGIVGALSLASIESVPEDLIDNAAVLGALCLVTALVFIADLLMTQPRKKSETGLQPYIGKDNAKQVTTLTTEKESSKTVMSGGTTPDLRGNGNINNAFEKMDDRGRGREQRSNQSAEPEQDRPRSQSLPHAERELREYKENFENGRALRDSQMRESEALQKSSRDYDDRRITYTTQDIYQRPVDEVDTPRFPTDIEGRTGHIVPKMVNPGIKIMRVEHDVEDTIDGYRYSDASQYDNVPIRMRGASPGILKKSRDVSFNVPPAPKGFRKGVEAMKDEIEMLEECFDVLRKTSTGTQTPSRTPSSPTDPGFVKHTASKWPYNAKSTP